MSYKSSLISQAREIEQLLKEYVDVHDKRLQSAGTLRSLFGKVDFKKIYENIDNVKRKFEKKDLELKELRDNYYEDFSDTEIGFFDTLDNYFNALFKVVKQLHLLAYRQYETSQGFLHNKRRLSWSENADLEKSYREKVKAYIELGNKLNQAFQALENEPDDFIDDEVVEEKPILNVLGIEIDDLMNKNVYYWAETDLETLEDQIKKYIKTNRNKEDAINYIENRLSHRSDKWAEIREVIENTTLSRVIKEGLISSIIERKEKPIKFLGERLDEENFPVLYRWAKSHPETLRKQLLGLARSPGGSVVNAMQSLESDLEHG